MACMHPKKLFYLINIQASVYQKRKFLRTEQPMWITGKNVWKTGTNLWIKLFES